MTAAMFGSREQALRGELPMRKRGFLRNVFAGNHSRHFDLIGGGDHPWSIELVSVTFGHVSGGFRMCPHNPVRIVEDHGGNLRLTETSPKGCISPITLPM